MTASENALETVTPVDEAGIGRLEPRHRTPPSPVKALRGAEDDAQFHPQVTAGHAPDRSPRRPAPSYAPGDDAVKPLLEEFRKRRFIEWMLAYAAGALLVLEVVDTLGPRWELTESAARGIDVSLALGFLFAVVLAWYHGPRGRQDPTGPELLILTLLLLLASLTLALVVDEPFRAPGEDDGGDASAAIHGRDDRLSANGAITAGPQSSGPPYALVRLPARDRERSAGLDPHAAGVELRRVSEQVASRVS